MRKLLAIVVCKLAALAGRIVKKGSSKPGQLALKICPDIIARMKLPDRVVAVTGSNGKTSTVEMIVRILERAGMNVCWNREGSNQIEGIATMLIRNATLTGRVKSDVIVMESDEQYARHTFRYMRPTHFAILNLYRDQMTRNGHPEFIFQRIRDAISPEMELILNADDPLISRFAENAKTVRWFGIDASAGLPEQPARYNDAVYCPKCGERLTFVHSHRPGFGDYRCDTCGYHRHPCDYAVTAADIADGTLTINHETALHTNLRVLFNLYNMLAAYAVAAELGVSPSLIAEVISDYTFRNGRIRSWNQNGREIALLTSKHENSTSYDQSIDLAVRRGGDVLFIVDAVSRKYFTGETSWLWDINFELLRADSIRTIYLAGKYVSTTPISPKTGFGSCQRWTISATSSRGRMTSMSSPAFRTGRSFCLACPATRRKERRTSDETDLSLSGSPESVRRTCQPACPPARTGADRSSGGNRQLCTG